MEKRSILDVIFGKKKPQATGGQNFTKLLNGFMPTFNIFGNDVAKSDVYQSAVQCHARHFSKMTPIAYGKNKEKLDEKLNRILQLRPNPLMGTAVFLEKCAYQYFVYNNVFIYIRRDNIGKVESLFVLDAQTMDVLKDEQNNIYIAFQFNGKRINVPYPDLIHIARNVTTSEFIGNNNDPILQTLRVIDTNYQGIENAIKISQLIRFIVSYSTTLNEDKKKEKAKTFKETFLSNEAEGMGVIIGDASSTITQVTSQPKYANYQEIELFDKKVYRYLGVNEKILDSQYTEDEWQAYYESVIEPFAIKLAQEMSYKIFTLKQLEAGSHIDIETDKLQYASFATRIKMIEVTQETGELTTNEKRQLLYLPPIEGGDVREVSLNYINSQIQDEYQLSKSTKKKEDGDDN